jgi:hypothetical protein
MERTAHPYYTDAMRSLLPLTGLVLGLTISSVEAASLFILTPPHPDNSYCRIWPAIRWPEELWASLGCFSGLGADAGLRVRGLIDHYCHIDIAEAVVVIAPSGQGPASLSAGLGLTDSEVRPFTPPL